MSLAEIKEAENEWFKWFKTMKELHTDEPLRSKPNVQNSRRLFEFVSRWGPPTLYWARPYKHWYKQIPISQSNKKIVLVWLVK